MGAVMVDGPAKYAGEVRVHEVHARQAVGSAGVYLHTKPGSTTRLLSCCL